MSDLVERVARTISVAPHTPEDCPPRDVVMTWHEAQARAAIREVLAALRTSEALEEVFDTHSPDLHTGEEIMGAVCAAFAREHGLADG